MRIGLVVDATCDLPDAFIREHDIQVLPIGIRLGLQQIVDAREPETTLAFYRDALPRVQADDGSEPLSAEDMKQWFLDRLVTRYDYVLCLTVGSQRSPIHDLATQASLSLLNSYHARREAAGVKGPFTLRVVDSHSQFAGVAVIAAEAARRLALGQGSVPVRTAMETLAPQICTFIVASDLGHLRRRGFRKGDRSGLSDRFKNTLLGLGSLLEMKPVISLTEDKPVSLSPSFDRSAEKLFRHAARRVEAGELLAPQLCVSYAGDPAAVRVMPGFDGLQRACTARDVSLHVGMLSPTGGINIGAGALSIAYAAPPVAFD